MDNKEPINGVNDSDYDIIIDMEDKEAIKRAKDRDYDITFSKDPEGGKTSVYYDIIEAQEDLIYTSVLSPEDSLLKLKALYRLLRRNPNETGFLIRLRLVEIVYIYGGSWELEKPKELQTTKASILYYLSELRRITIETEQRGDNVIPTELATKQAKRYLKKLVKAGYLNPDYSVADKVRRSGNKKKTDKSLANLAILADIIAERLEFTHRWKPFIELWGELYLSQKTYSTNEADSELAERRKELAKLLD